MIYNIHNHLTSKPFSRQFCLQLFTVSHENVTS